MSEPSVSSIAIYQLRVVLCGVSPLVWRRLLVVRATGLAELHDVLQTAFDWSGEHLHRFLIHGTAYGIRCLGGIVFREDALRVPLSRFRLHCGERFRYEYDFTADWKLDIGERQKVGGWNITGRSKSPVLPFKRLGVVLRGVRPMVPDTGPPTFWRSRLQLLNGLLVKKCRIYNLPQRPKRSVVIPHSLG